MHLVEHVFFEILKCQQITNFAKGAPYSVKVKAILGKTETCSPSDIPYNPDDPNNVTFHAWGQTLNVHCSQLGATPAPKAAEDKPKSE